MMLKIRQCCCSLSTFVRIVSLIFLISYLFVGLAGVFWFLFYEHRGSSTFVNIAEKEDGEINGFEEFAIGSNVSETSDGSFRKIVIFSIVLVFALTGVMVNMLVILSIRVGKRTLILPWLVYHTGVIIGKHTE